MRRAVWVLPAILLGLALPVQAAPIVVSAGQVVTFNFDFGASNVIPPPPYQAVQFEPRLDTSTLDATDHGLFRGFSELDGNGAQIFGPQFVNFLGTVLTTEGDGIFSMVLTVTSGSFTVNPVAFGYEDQRLLTGAVAPLSVVVSTVPEPATLTLVALGLAAAARRRRLTR
jgi:hypothetical protein